MTMQILKGIFNLSFIFCANLIWVLLAATPVGFRGKEKPIPQESKYLFDKFH